jgi:hypothetical protein
VYTYFVGFYAIVTLEVRQKFSQSYYINNIVNRTNDENKDFYMNTIHNDHKRENVYDDQTKFVVIVGGLYIKHKDIYTLELYQPGDTNAYEVVERGLNKLKASH